MDCVCSWSFFWFLEKLGKVFKCQWIKSLIDGWFVGTFDRCLSSSQLVCLQSKVQFLFHVADWAREEFKESVKIECSDLISKLWRSCNQKTPKTPTKPQCFLQQNLFSHTQIPKIKLISYKSFPWNQIKKNLTYVTFTKRKQSPLRDLIFFLSLPANDSHKNL